MSNSDSKPNSSSGQNSGSSGGKGDRFLTFYLSGEEYGLEILSVREIIGLLPITKMPRTPDYIRGVINLRGKVIPVMDLRIKFGMKPQEDTVETCIIVVEVAHEGRPILVGVLVDRVSEVLSITTSQLEETPSLGGGINTDFIKGMANTQDSVIMLLDIEKVVGAGDRELADKTER